METISAAIMLFLIMDPLGNLPIFMSVLKNVPKQRRKKILIRELLISLFIMITFLYFGSEILALLHLRPESVSIAGGIILFLIALRMIFPSKHSNAAGIIEGQEPLIVPLAIPLIAGPSLLATLILFAHQDPSRINDWLLALLGAWLCSSIILMLSGTFLKILGERGLLAIEKLMGMLLVMISIQLLLDGFLKYINLAT